VNILVVGTGYVGATTAVVLAEMGWQVTGLDTDAGKVSMLRNGTLPIYEEGLEELLRKHLQLGNIQFTTEVRHAIEDNEVIYICVGTPSTAGGSADLRYVRQVAENIGRYMNGYKLVINKSTVPVGTQEKVAEWIRNAQLEPHSFDVASNPEFLREGQALQDALHPDRVVIGVNSERAERLLKTVYQSLECPFVVTKPRTAELIKYASNAFLAAKISYMNELAILCDRLDVNVKEVAVGMGFDPRIAPGFLQAGIGYGGSCFPKDVAALLHLSEEHNIYLTVLQQVSSVNRRQYLHLLDKARAQLGDFRGKKLAVLGVAFKPDTDDIREAPSIRLIRTLAEEPSLVIHAHDPIAKLPQELSSERIVQFPTPEEALKNADAVLICTEWPLYRKLDWGVLVRAMNRPYVFDGRNMLDSKHMAALGYYYEGIGYR
jgi:UDPglucose 6-dehydrogenase